MEDKEGKGHYEAISLNIFRILNCAKTEGCKFFFLFYINVADARFRTILKS